jgi:hypothetical protein
MKIWVVMAKVEEVQARSIDKVFDSKEKAYNYIKEQEKSEHFVNLAGIDRSIAVVHLCYSIDIPCLPNYFYYIYLDSKKHPSPTPLNC